MAEEVVLVATGVDRPGVLDELSQFLLESGVNIADSHAVNLRGLFAMLLLVRGEPPALEAVRGGLQVLGERGIRADLHRAAPKTANTFPYRFLASGTDQKGVLHRVSHLMRVLNVNIDNIETHVSADTSFQIGLDLSVPRETPVTMLRDYLTYLCKELGIQGELKER